MPVTITNRAVHRLHRKEWQMMTQAPVGATTGSFVVHDRAHLADDALFVMSATGHYIYSVDEDAWVQAPSGALAGTFGAGACGTRARWSRTQTANGGSTTTVTTAAVFTDRIVGAKIRMLTGTAGNIGLERTVLSYNFVAGGTSTITLDVALPSAVANTDTFALETGRVFVLNAGTFAAGSFKEWDWATCTWGSNLAITNLPATWGTDGKLICTPSHVQYATGTATAGAATTLTNGAKTWTVNGWTNYQIRITAGTGIGQIRTIASNTATVITVSAAWTTTPDATSVYAIEPNDDILYLMGNNAVTLYKYVISTNTWSTLTPGVARAGAPIAGMSGSFMQQSGNATWGNESTIQDGRYLFSFRGGATIVDRYDIALNTWVAVTPNPTLEIYGAGSGYETDGAFIYIRKDATNRFLRYNTVYNTLDALSTNYYPDGAGQVGDKVWISALPEQPTVKWLYSLQNTGQVVHRMLLI